MYSRNQKRASRSRGVGQHCSPNVHIGQHPFQGRTRRKKLLLLDFLILPGSMDDGKKGGSRHYPAVSGR